MSDESKTTFSTKCVVVGVVLSETASLEVEACRSRRESRATTYSSAPYVTIAKTVNKIITPAFSRKQQAVPDRSMWGCARFVPLHMTSSDLRDSSFWLNIVAS